MSRLILLAASGLAREVIAAVEAGDQHEVIGVLDDDVELHGTSVHGVPVLGPIADALHHPDVSFVACAGQGRARRQIVAGLGQAGITRDRYASLIDSSVRLPSSCRLGSGTILLAQCVLTADITIGHHVVVMPNVTLTHDDQIDDYATLCANVTLGGSVHVGSGSYLGMSSSVRERLAIGENATLGMGSALLRDLPPGQTWAGCPARPINGSRSSTAALPSVKGHIA